MKKFILGFLLGLGLVSFIASAATNPDYWRLTGGKYIVPLSNSWEIGTSTTVYHGNGSGLSGVAGTNLWALSGNSLYPTSSAYMLTIGTTTPGTETETIVGSTTDSTAAALNVKNSAGTSLVYVRNDGKIGVGTTTPAYKLDVVSDIRVNGLMIGFGNGQVSTNAVYGTNNFAVGNTAPANTAIGASALRSLASGNGENIAIGANTLYSLTSGRSNQAIGSNAMYFGTGQNYSTAIGNSAFQNGAPSYSAAIGYGSGWYAGGSNIVAIGANALAASVSPTFAVQTVTNSTAIGAYAGYTSRGTNNLFLGYYAGAYETGSSKFYVDNQDRTDEATGKTNALMYGVMNATPANQTLTINAKVGIGTTTPSFPLDVVGYTLASAPYGELWTNDDNGTLTTTSTNTYYAWKRATTTLVQVSGTDYVTATTTVGATSTLNIASLGFGMYKVNLAISATSDTNNTIMHCSVFKNETENTNVEFERKIGTAGDVGSGSASGLLQLVANDILSVRCKSDKTGAVLTLNHVNLSINRIAR